MKKTEKVLSLCVLIFLLTTGTAFTEEKANLKDLHAAVDSFSTSIAKSLPFNSTIGLNWSDAYIGQLVGIPPHFGFGTTFGITTLDIALMNNLLKHFESEVLFDFEIPDWFGLPLPAITADFRIGGFILPFDIGFKIAYLDSSNWGLLNEFTPFGLEYMLIGGDVRYALIDRRLVKLSLGLGFNHLGGVFSITGPDGVKPFYFEVEETEYSISVNNPNVSLAWQTNNIELKTQVSFIHFIVTPYVGLGLGYGWSKAGYKVNGRVDGNTSQFKEHLSSLGITNFTEAVGFESIMDVSDFNMRAFGGLSLNLAVFKFDFTAMYNILGNNFGATFGMRFQL